MELPAGRKRAPPEGGTTNLLACGLTRRRQRCRLASARRASYARFRRVSQRGLLHLPRSRTRHFALADEEHVARHLVAGERLLAEGDQLVNGGDGVGLDDDEG